MSLVDLSSGDRVALLLPGSVAYVEPVMDLLARGVIPVPLDPKLTPAERDRMLPYVDAALVIDDAAAILQPERASGGRARSRWPGPCT